MNLKIETGRSMVEMLGTLAIIGVLSIGGIAGYSYGMDKHRCNQTINDIMLMGVDIITQTSRGAVPTLSEWGTKTTAGYDFSVEPNPTDATKYGIVVDGVPSRVCQMVGDALKTQATVYVGNVDYTTANTNPCEASEENTMKFYFENGAVESDGCKTDSDCGEGNYCDFGLCFSGDKPEVSKALGTQCTLSSDCNSEWSGNNCALCQGQVCVEDTFTDGYSCVLKNGNIAGQCYNGQCIAKGCNEGNPCQNKDEYCASPNTPNSECKAFHNGAQGACVKPDFKAYKIDDKIYYISNSYLSRWDAEAACQALGRQLNRSISLISVSELIINNDGSKWTGGTSTKASILAEKLYNVAGDLPSIWTSDEYAFCNGYVVYLSGYVTYNYSYNHNYANLAICR